MTFSDVSARKSVAPQILWLTVLLPGLLFVVGAYGRRWAGDDGLINLRVVRQLMAGNGFVYNAGERTEAVTSAAWVMLLWLVGELGIDVPTAAWILSLTFSFIGLVLAALASARLSARHDAQPTLVLPLGVLAYAAIPVAWDYGTSALENGLGLGFLGTMYWLTARATTASEGRPAYAVASFCGLGPLVRPDFTLYAAPMVLILILSTRSTRARVWLALTALLPGVAYEIFRMGYFACLVPNTALAKEAFSARWDQGLRFFDNTFETYALFVPLTCCALAFVMGRSVSRTVPARMVSLSLAAAGALHILYVVRLGGDFMHGRMLLPGLFAIFAAAAVHRVPLPVRTKHEVDGQRHRRQVKWIAALVLWLAPVLGVASWAAYCATSLRVEKYLPNIQDERGYYLDSSGVAHPTRVEDYARHDFYISPMVVRQRVAVGCPWGDSSMDDQARELCPRWALPDASDGVLTDWSPNMYVPLEAGSTAPFVLGVFGFRPLGIAGLAVGLRMNVVDSFGLADAVASRMTMGERGRPGHEKSFLTHWFAGKYVAEGATADPRAITAKRVLRCGLLGQLHAATHEPMSVKRFFRNMRLAWPLHRLRIPGDPNEAERLFCKT
jgi:arabinofuranosyltransferase